jgi:hypothetical protein
LVFDPTRREIHVLGRTNGTFDGVRLAQSMDNLLVKYATNGTRLASFAFGSIVYDFIESGQYDRASDMIFIAARLGPFDGLIPSGSSDVYWAAFNPTNYSRIRHGMFGSAHAVDNPWEMILVNTNSTNGTMIFAGEGGAQPFDGASMGNTSVISVGFVSQYFMNGTKMWTSVLSAGPDSRTLFKSVAVYSEFIYATVCFRSCFP